MTEAQCLKFTKSLNEMSLDELIESRRLITSMIGLKQSYAVLRGSVERPGRRGKRWKKGSNDGGNVNA